MKKLLIMLFLLSSVSAWTHWDECHADFEIEAEVYSCRGDILVLEVLNKHGAEYQITPNETYVELLGGLKIPIAPERTYPGLAFLPSCPPCDKVTFYSAPPQGIPESYVLTAHISAGGECAEVELSGNKIPCAGYIEIPDIQTGFNPETGEVTVNGTFDSSDHTRIYTLGILHRPSASVEDFIFGPDVLPFTSRKKFTSEQARNIEVVLFVRNRTEGFYGHSTGNRLSFADVSLSIDAPDIVSPGKSETIKVSLENTGTLADSYSLSLDVPIGWETVTTQTREISTGEIIDVEIPILVSDDFKESDEITLNLDSSEGRKISKSFTISAEKEIMIVPDLVIPSLLTIGEETDYTVRMRVFGTTSSNVQYIILPDPYVRHSFKDTQTVAELGKLNLKEGKARIIEACGLDYERTATAHGGQLAVLYANMARWMSREPEGQMDRLRTISGRLTELKLTLIDVRMGRQIDTVIDRIDRFIRDYEDGRDLTSARERLIGAVNDMNRELPNLEDALFGEGCVQLDSVDLKLFVVPYEDLNLTTSQTQVEISGRPVIMVDTATTNLRVRSGSTRSVILNVTNGGETERRFTFKAGGSAAAWAYLPRDLTLQPGHSNLVELRIQPPRYVAGEYDFNFIVESDPYTASIPFILEAGEFDVGLTVIDDIHVEPGESKSYNVSVRNLGDLADIYDVTVSGPIWGTVDIETLEVEPGDTEMLSFTVAPLSDVSEGNYRFTVTATSKADDRTYAFGRVTVRVTREAEILRSRIDRSHTQLEILAEEFGWDRRLREVENTLQAAEDYLDAGRFTEARTRISRAESDLSRLSDELVAVDDNGPNLLFIAIILAVILGTILVILYMMGKSKKETEDDQYDYGDYNY